MATIAAKKSAAIRAAWASRSRCQMVECGGQADKDYYSGHEPFMDTEEATSELYEGIIAKSTEHFIYKDMHGTAVLYEDGSVLHIVDGAGWLDIDTYTRVIVSKSHKIRAIECMQYL